jgi:hypothetical protein
MRVAVTAEEKNLSAADPATFLPLRRGGVCAGAIQGIEVAERALPKSGRPAPDFHVAPVVHPLKSWRFASIREVKWSQEDVGFAVPSELTSWKSTHTENLSTS